MYVLIYFDQLHSIMFNFELTYSIACLFFCRSLHLTLADMSYLCSSYGSYRLATGVSTHVSTVLPIDMTPLQLVQNSEGLVIY